MILIVLYCCPYSSQKQICENWISQTDQIINFQPNQFNMPSEALPSTQDVVKVGKKPTQFGSNSSRSDKYASASKSMKAFEESLRKQDSNSGKSEDVNSPLKQKLNFGKNEPAQPKQNEKIYLVDTLKKIRKVESPFKESPAVEECQNQIQSSQNNLLVSCFDPISQRIQDQGESSLQLEKIGTKRQEIKIPPLDLNPKVEIIDNMHNLQGGIQQEREVIYISFEDNFQPIIEVEKDQSNLIQPQMIEEKEQIFQELLNVDEIKDSSLVVSSKSKSSEASRLRKKEMKIKKRKEKRKTAKNMKTKLQNITNFVDQLHRSKVHTDRKDLISELSVHLCEKKFGRLRNELKKLI